jgi:hypothetical protein
MQCTVGVANWAMRYREFVIRGRYELRTREREVCCQRDESGAPRGAQWALARNWRALAAPHLPFLLAGHFFPARRHHAISPHRSINSALSRFVSLHVYHLIELI